MSLQFTVTCLDCRTLAPSLGDGGFLGAPLIGSVEHVDWRGTPMPSFGYFYDALVGLGIRPYELEVFREFLSVHDGHRVVLSSDHDAASDKTHEAPEAESLTSFEPFTVEPDAVSRYLTR